jgi:hypothetical protein
MTEHIMTAYGSHADGGPGSRTVIATFRGPSLVAPETGYDTGGSVLDLTTKPAAALVAADADTTAGMLYSVVRKVNATPSTGALDLLYRARYVPAVAGAPATGRLRVFTASAVTVTTTLAWDDGAGIFATAGLVGTQNVVLPAGHRFVRGRLTLTENFVHADATGLVLEVGFAGDPDGLLDTDAVQLYAGPPPVGTTSSLLGAAALPGLIAVNANTNMVITGTMTTGGAGVLTGFTAGEATVELTYISNEAWDDPANWGEVANATDLSGVTFVVEAEGL